MSDYEEVYRLTYFGGIAGDLRTQIWPYLLGHYKFGTTTEQRRELDEETKQAYVLGVERKVSLLHFHLQI